MDLLLVQWMLAMSLVTNGVSRFFSQSWSLLCCSDSTASFLSGFEGLSIKLDYSLQSSCPTLFPFMHMYSCTVFSNSADVHGQIYRVTILFDSRIMEKSKRTDEQVARGTMLRNFWQTFYGKMNSVRLSLVSAVVKASLLLRCGDVETNPGPVGKYGKIAYWYMYTRATQLIQYRPYLLFLIMLESQRT